MDETMTSQKFSGMTQNYVAAMPTAIENWPEHVLSLSFETVSLPLSTFERHAFCVALLSVQGDEITEDPQPIRAALDAVTSRMDEAIRSFGDDGAFVKLSLRSPKDSSMGLDAGTLRVTSGAQARHMIFNSMERMVDDFMAAEEADIPTQIHIRRWETIQPWAEFRCFMRDRKLIGISQYKDREAAAFDEIVENAPMIQASIENFFAHFRGISHLEDAVFDVAFTGERPYWPLMPVLIELNPFRFHQMGGTYPCLFEDLDFDGSFRYLGDGIHMPQEREADPFGFLDEE